MTGDAQAVATADDTCHEVRGRARDAAVTARERDQASKGIEAGGRDITTEVGRAADRDGGQVEHVIIQIQIAEDVEAVAAAVQTHHELDGGTEQLCSRAQRHRTIISLCAGGLDEATIDRGCTTHGQAGQCVGATDEAVEHHRRARHHKVERIVHRAVEGDSPTGGQGRVRTHDDEALIGLVARRRDIRLKVGAAVRHQVVQVGEVIEHAQLAVHRQAAAAAVEAIDIYELARGRQDTIATGQCDHIVVGLRASAGDIRTQVGGAGDLEQAEVGRRIIQVKRCIDEHIEAAAVERAGELHRRGSQIQACSQCHRVVVGLRANRGDIIEELCGAARIRGDGRRIHGAAEDGRACGIRQQDADWRTGSADRALQVDAAQASIEGQGKRTRRRASDQDIARARARLQRGGRAHGEVAVDGQVGACGR